MKNKRIVIILSMAAMFLCSGLTNASAKPTIKEIRFESPSKNTDQVIFVLNGPHLPTGKALPGENPRIYFDFPDTTPANKVKTRMSTNGNFVKQVRYAFHKTPKTKTRVVFDLLANEKIEFKQAFDQNTNTLVITLYLAGTDPEQFAAAPEPKPEPVAVEKPAVAEEPVVVEKPATKIPAPVPAPVTTKKPELSGKSLKDIGKEVPPVKDVSIVSVPELQKVVPEPKAEVEKQVQETIPEVTRPVTKETPVETIVAVPEPPPQMEKPQAADTKPSAETAEMIEAPSEEATIIQPMSEVGIQEKETAEDAAPLLREIEFDPKSNRGEVISFKLNGFHPPVVFGIEEDIPRIVCFFKNASAGNNLQDMIETNGRYVKNIKIGKYTNPENIRVVLELVPGNNYDLQQIFFKDDKVFMMIINKAGKQASSEVN